MAADFGIALAAKSLMTGEDTWQRFNLKSCARCRGDLYLELEDHIVFAKCLQCSRNFEVGSGSELWAFLQGRLTGQTAA